MYLENAGNAMHFNKKYPKLTSITILIYIYVYYFTKLFYYLHLYDTGLLKITVVVLTICHTQYT